MNKDGTVAAKTGKIRSTQSNKRLRQSSPSSSVFPSDVQQPLVIKEEVFPEWSPILDQEDPGPLQVKEEQEELCIKELNGLEEDDITRSSFTAFSSEDDEISQSSQIHRSQIKDNRESPASKSAIQIKKETYGEDSGGSVPSTNRDCSETDLQKGANVVEKPFGCDVCGTRFSHKKTHNRHMRVHKGEIPYTCDVCGIRFTQQGNLKRHMRVHTGEKPFGCDVCGKRFTFQASLSSHRRVHTGNKPFGCDVCGKKFTFKANLSSHMRVHSGEKPFTCHICGTRFSHKKTQDRHMRVHTGEKPFACDVCGKRFIQQGNMKRHMRVHTRKKAFGCDVCGKKFTFQAKLSSHMKVHTGQQT
ncbi:gastrula zinc finger protein XlCGF8.2DB-like isoform X2 [Sparus aurata]|uniref:gastrula zinc finger protein XlCGF8.2DB-like isoform X2 n=1 Tax=Sparus aurata TaxID=8175 RepID=UPI0011C1BE9F|nr:gastrula zinc finger protein XlCGF8.2DB-like isoform X2 [Sparus aurata]